MILLILLFFNGALFGALTYEEWEMVSPYLLPETHPAKPILDQMFEKESPLRTQETLKAAGFKLVTKGHWSDTVIATHKALRGYYFKMFTEDQTDINEIPRLIARIKGALVAQEIVDKHEWNHLFKVPRKWLYLVMEDHVILIAEDMRLLSKHESYKKWAQATLSKKLLESVFVLLTEGGFSDSAYAFNLPFATDGRIALIDNDTFNKRPVPFSKLLKYLHPKLQKHGETLIQQFPSLAY